MKRKNQLPKTQQEILPQHRLFDTTYLRDMLNIRINAVYDLCNDRKIEHFKIGRLIYFHETGINDFLERSKVTVKLTLVLLLYNICMASTDTMMAIC